MGVLSDGDLVAMRTRARHRLIGALAFVVVLVAGVPMLIDHHDAPVAEDSEPPRTAEANPAPAAPDKALPAAPSAKAGPVVVPDAPTGGPAPVIAPAGGPTDRQSAPAAEAGTTPAIAGVAGPVAPFAPVAGPAGHSGGSDVPAAAAPIRAPLAAPDTIPPLGTQSPAVRRDAARAHPTELARGPQAGDRPKSRLSAPGKPHAESAAPAAATDESGDQAAGPPRGWFVQVGVFLEAARADAVAKRLESEGVHVHSEAIHGPRGNFTRVRAGPFAARAAADEVLARVKGLGENAILVHQ